MSVDDGDAEVMARALLETIYGTAKRRPMNAIQICAALGAVAAVIMAEAQPEDNEIADTLAIESLVMSFTEMLTSRRRWQEN
jgi:hypothetical protein